MWLRPEEAAVRERHPISAPNLPIFSPCCLQSFTVQKPGTMMSSRKTFELNTEHILTHTAPLESGGFINGTKSSAARACETPIAVIIAAIAIDPFMASSGGNELDYTGFLSATGGRSLPPASRDCHNQDKAHAPSHLRRSVAPLHQFCAGEPCGRRGQR